MHTSTAPTFLHALHLSPAGLCWHAHARTPEWPPRPPTKAKSPTPYQCFRYTSQSPSCSLPTHAHARSFHTLTGALFPHTHSRSPAHTRTHIHTHIHTCTHMHTHAHTCAHTHARAYTHTTITYQHRHHPRHHWVHLPMVLSFITRLQGSNAHSRLLILSSPAARNAHGHPASLSLEK